MDELLARAGKMGTAFTGGPRHNTNLITRSFRPDRRRIMTNSAIISLVQDHSVRISRTPIDIIKAWTFARSFDLLRSSTTLVIQYYAKAHADSVSVNEPLLELLI